MSNLKILVVSGAPTDACTYYRAIQPLRLAARHFPIQWDIADQRVGLGAHTLCRYDIVLLMRPSNEDHLRLAEAVRASRVTLWVDYDDDIFNVPYDHDGWHTFADDTTRAIVKHCVERANIVTLSTETLKEAFKLAGVNVSKAHVKANAIDMELFPEPTKARAAGTSRLVAWRGGPTHRRDLAFAAPIFPILEKRHNIRFIFMGMRPIPLVEAGYITPGTFTHLGPTNLQIEFFDQMRKVNAPVHIVPLYDCPLNRSKSNIAYLEASWFGGSAVVGPPWWTGEKGLIAAADNEHMLNAIVAFFDDVDQSNRILSVELAQQHIRENFDEFVLTAQLFANLGLISVKPKSQAEQTQATQQNPAHV